MTIESRLKPALFVTIGLGLVAYCVAEGNVALALGALPLWLLSWPLALGGHGRPAPRWALIAIAGALSVYTLYEAVRSPEDLVAGISRFIVWLQVIRLYDRGGARERGQTLALSVFLVLGACLTSNSFWLGVTLLAYAPSALWTIALHQLSAEESRVRRFVADGRPGGEPGEAPAPVELTRAGRRALRRVWVVSGVSSAVLAAVVFLALPRGYGQGFLGDVGVVAPEPVSGLPPEVRLGNTGLISTSQAVVFDLLVEDERGENIGALLRPLRMRAVTMDEYIGGRWVTSQRSQRRQAGAPLRPTEPIGPVDQREGVAMVKQTLQMRRGAQERLVALLRPVRIECEDTVSLQVNRHDLTFGRPSEALRRIVVWSQPDAARTLRDERGDWRYPPAFREGAVHDYAAGLMSEAGFSRDPEEPVTSGDHAIATLFEQRLMRDYEYSDVMVAARDGEDPIEMFLTRTRSGHCEYFAAALAAMLRSVGIDARVVTGYLATEFDGERFIIRESHAHAWVEARTAPETWRTYDASPPEGVAAAQRGAGLLGALRSLVARAQAFWVSAVVGYDQERQQAALGDETSWLRQFFDRLWPEQRADGAFTVDARKGLLRVLQARGIGAAFVAATLAVAAVISRASQVIARRRGCGWRRARTGGCRSGCGARGSSGRCRRDCGARGSGGRRRAPRWSTRGRCWRWTARWRGRRSGSPSSPTRRGSGGGTGARRRRRRGSGCCGWWWRRLRETPLRRAAA